MQVLDIAENDNPWTLFVETLNPESGLKELPQFDKESKKCIELKEILSDPFNPYHVLGGMHVAGYAFLGDE